MVYLHILLRIDNFYSAYVSNTNYANMKNKLYEKLRTIHTINICFHRNVRHQFFEKDEFYLFYAKHI